MPISRASFPPMIAMATPDGHPVRDHFHSRTVTPFAKPGDPAALNPAVIDLPTFPA
jgi:hypothetical protein